MHEIVKAAMAAKIEGAGLIEFGWTRVTGCPVGGDGKPLKASKNHYGCHIVAMHCAVIVTKNGEIWCKIGDFSEEEAALKASTSFHPGLTLILDSVYGHKGLHKNHIIERFSNPLAKFNF